MGARDDEDHGASVPRSPALEATELDRLSAENAALRERVAVLSTSRERLRAMLDASFASAIVFESVRDPRTGRVVDFVVVEANQPAAELAGTTRSQLMGARLSDGLPGGRELAARLLPVAEGGESVDFDVRLPQRSFDASSGPLHARSRAMRLGEDVVVAAIDLTEHDALLARAAHDDRLASLSRLALGVAHEMNNPLSWVMTNLEHVRTELALSAGSEELRASVEDALHGTTRLQKIVDDLRTGTESTTLDPAGIDVGPAIVAALRMTGHVLHARAIISLHVPPDLPRALADAGRLEQVLTNLVSNAARALMDGGRPGGHVHVEALCEHDDTIVIRVTDDGPGMDERRMARAFEPFFTSDPTRGAGLGLWISRRLVEAFGGTLTLRSTPGVGTTAELVLLRSQEEPAAATEAALPLPTRRESPRLRVLVIDDEPLIGRALKRSLPEHDVTYEERGDRAVARVQDGEEFDVVLCDLTMPGTDGLTVLDAIAAASPRLASRMVLMTGGASDEALTAIAARGLRVIDKPFSPDTLAAALLEASHDR